jgi:drug/metabolite transporter (DMT)-like permease
MVSRLLSSAFTSAPLLLSLATLGWAGNTIAGRLAVGEVSPLVIVFMRWTIVFAILLMTKRKELPAALPKLKGKWPWVFMMGALGLSFFNTLFYIAAQSTTAINLGLIQCAMPMFILIGATLILKTKLTFGQIIGTILTMAGVLLIISKGDFSFLVGLQINKGDWIMLGACIFYAGYTIGLQNRPDIDNMTMMTVFAGAAWVLSIPILLIEVTQGTAQWPATQLAWLIVLFISLIPSFISQVFYMRGVDLIGPDRAGVYSNLVPIYSAALGVLILNEAFSLYHFLSIIIVITGLTVISRSKPIENHLVN